MNNQKEIICIDVDETIAKTVEDAVFPVVNEQYGTNFTLETTHNYRDILQDKIQINGISATMEQKIEIYKSAVALDIGKNQVGTISGSIEKILELSSSFQINLLTARHQDLLDYTFEWAKANYNWAINKILSSNCCYWGKVTKSFVCNEIWARIMIEDDMDYATELAQKWIKVFLLSKPWNIHRKEKHRNIQRVDSWSDIQI